MSNRLCAIGATRPRRAAKAISGGRSARPRQTVRRTRDLTRITESLGLATLQLGFDLVRRIRTKVQRNSIRILTSLHRARHLASICMATHAWLDWAGQSRRPFCNYMVVSKLTGARFARELAKNLSSAIICTHLDEMACRNLFAGMELELDDAIRRRSRGWWKRIRDCWKRIHIQHTKPGGLIERESHHSRGGGLLDRDRNNRKHCRLRHQLHSQKAANLSRRPPFP
jgi:hypothetical protein